MIYAQICTDKRELISSSSIKRTGFEDCTLKY